MATSSKNNVSLVIEAGVTGEAEIRRFADEVRRLAKEGGDAAPEFQALAASLDNLATQGGALAALKALTDEVNRLGEQQKLAREQADAAGTALARQKEAADALRASQTELKNDIGAARIEVVKAQNELAEYTKGFDAAGKRTIEYRNGLGELQAALSQARLGLAEKRAELDRLAPTVAEAVQAENRLSSQYDRLNESATRGAGALRQRAAALADAEAAAQAAGVGAADLVAAENRLLEATQAAAIQTARLVQERRDAAAASAALADLDAQNAAALGQQQARLIAIVEAHEREQQALAEAAAAARAKRQADEEAIFAASAKAAAVKLAAEAAERERVAAAEAAAELRRLAEEADQAERDFQALARAEREAAAAAEALSAAEGTAAVRRLEESARLADAEVRDLAASLRTAETAAVEFSVATERAAAAGRDDVVATQERVRAARALIEAEQQLNVAQRELAAQRDANRASLVAEAQALLASARAAEESRAATARLVGEATRAGAALTAAFGQTGVRSLQAIEAEVITVERSMALLEQQFRAGAISSADLSRALSSAQVRLATLNAEAKNIPALPREIDKIAASVNAAIAKFAGLGAALATVGAAVRPVIEAEIALEQMRRTLTTVTGSAQVAEQQIAFLRRTAQESGQSFTELGSSYAKFAASALQSGVSLQDTQAVFRSVALAAGNLGLSSDQAKRALEALSQIASKGVVSMEELRQQLGDALPGVLPLLAKELGLTQAELNKVVESGQLLASEAIPAIGRSLQALQPQNGAGVDGLVASWNRFKNVVLEAGTAIIEGPLGQGAGTILTAFAGVLRDIAFVAVSASQGVLFLGQSIGATAAFIASGAKDFDGYKATISGFAEEAGAKIERFKQTAYGASETVKNLGAIVAAAAPSFAKLALEQQKVVNSADVAARAAETLAQAHQKAATSAATLIGLSGDEQKALDATAAAQRAYASALETQAVADERAADARRAFRDTLIAEATARGQSLDTIKAAVDALNAEIRVKDAAAAKSREQADAYKATATAAQLQADTFRDNASKIDEYRAAVEAAANAANSARTAMARGITTIDDVRKADDALAVAKARLRDALNDQIAASERLVNGLKVEADFTKALLELDIAKLKIKRDEALLRGAEIEANQLAIRIAELELQVSKTTVDAKRAEANELIRSLTLRKQELAALGQLTPELEAEINVRIRRAQIQAVEADTANVATTAEEKRLQAVRNGTQGLDGNTTSSRSNADATSASTDAINANTSARSKNASATRDQVSAQERYNRLLRDDPTRLVGGIGLGGINGRAGEAPAPGVRGPDGVRSPGGSDNKLSGDGGTDFSVLGPTGSSSFTGNAQIPVPDGYYFTLDPYAPGAIPAGYTNTGLPYGGYFAPVGGQGVIGGSSSRSTGSSSSSSGSGSGTSPSPNGSRTSGLRTVTLKFDFGAGRQYELQGSQGAADGLISELSRAQLASRG